jgi:hypothetical protein
MPPIREAPHVQLEPQGLDSWWWRPWGRKVVMALVLYASIVNIYIYIYVYITIFCPTVASRGEEKKGRKRGSAQWVGAGVQHSL